MKAFATATMIQATPQAVWAVLTDGAQWAQWNPTVDKVDGKIAAGEKNHRARQAQPGPRVSSQGERV